ncbi:hypothetical protein MMC17_007752 [Xylographa soralifera]|nr:hypothetical protein [Xylographa soralifera]
MVPTRFQFAFPTFVVLCWITLSNASILQKRQGVPESPTVPDIPNVSLGSSSFNPTATTSVTPVPSKKPGPVPAGIPTGWTYRGCFIDNVYGKILSTGEADNAAETIEACIAVCQSLGNTVAGIEYASQCSCGNEIVEGGTLAPEDTDCNMACSGNSAEICGGPNRMSIYATDCGDVANIAQNGATTEPSTDCNTVCSGDPRYLCGSGNRISYYAWTGTPLYTWATPTGNAAGAYEFLIGGVVVPLIASPARNGKVTFLEKHGTGPPNSTGAYELDLAQLNNFTGAWRPMTGLQTDVFCSAGLTLPDRAGRQLDVGGWSGTSTFGIRMYWPDGSPGVWGVNEWQENAAEVALQTGRWYPSAMILSNGSILVVGGENGSNGPPVPNMELLPRVGGLVSAPYLAQTDPFSLYPFLAVLPSGGIFIGYYNQAQILSPVTLTPIKTLPGIPGSVNDFLSGRTYPFEGAMMLMPQAAPYTALVTVMICGGSNPGAAIAVDNCVSIQPDATNPQWVLERMPNKRVMPCITALPDGTYLIANGAEQGVAGFGLATDPNLNAILYDPTKPVNSRMSIMANTTVARLYHSESVLLNDGRVLISGSDPEDGVHPQEYRVEVFVPPYILSGLPRPSFTIQNIDWTYGQAVTFTVTAGTATKVSLLGAVASTHGNSMGQRTIFPAFSCSGNTCTVTAPPNNKICPPGWFQMFVLNGPTPSIATWVRIGGDPASLGNWPPFPDFTVPGMGPAI